MSKITKEAASEFLKGLKGQNLAYLKRFNQQQRRDIDTLISGMSKQVLMEFEISSSLTSLVSLSPPNPAGSDLLTRIWKGFLNMIGWRISSASLFDKICKLDGTVLIGPRESRPVEALALVERGLVCYFGIEDKLLYAADVYPGSGVAPVLPPSDQVRLRLLELDTKYAHIGFYAEKLLSSPELFREQDHDINLRDLIGFEAHLENSSFPRFHLGFGFGSLVRAFFHDKFVLDKVQKPGFLKSLFLKHLRKELWGMAGLHDSFSMLLLGLAYNNPSYIAAVASAQESKEVWAVDMDYLEGLDKALECMGVLLKGFFSEANDHHVSENPQVCVLKKIQGLPNSKLLDLLDKAMQGCDASSLWDNLFEADSLDMIEMKRTVGAPEKVLRQFESNFMERLHFILSSPRISFALDACSLARVSYIKTRADLDSYPELLAYVAAYEPFFAVAKEESCQIDDSARTLIRIRLLQVFRFILGAPGLGITPQMLDQKIAELG